MSVFVLNNIARDTGSENRARLTDATGATIAEAAGTEAAAGLFDFSVTYAGAVTYPTYWEVRTVPTQDTAGFNAGTDAEGPFLYAVSPALAAADTIRTPATINPDGLVPLTMSFSYGGVPTDFDSISYTLFKNGVAVTGPTIDTLHATGSGIYQAVATATGFASGDSGTLLGTGVYRGVSYTKSQDFTVVAVPTPLTIDGTIGYTTCYGDDLQPLDGVRFRFQLKQTDGTAAQSFAGEYRYATSANGGLVSIELPKGAKHWAWRETSKANVWGPVVEFTTGTGDRTALPAVLGKPVT